MKRSNALKFTSIAICLALSLALLLSGCGSSGSLNGTITVAGATSFQPLVEKCAKDLVEKNENKFTILVQGGGSGTGLTQVAQGAVAIGNSDVYAAEKLTDGSDKVLVDHIVCVNGFAAVVNPGVDVENVTQQQLIDIFTGKITNWKDVGGKDLKITLINRPKSSGTRATFKKYALNGEEEAEDVALKEDSSGTVKKTVADTEGAISYLALNLIDTTVKALKLDGVEANKENITTGKYPVWSYEHMYTKGEAKGVAKELIDYILSDEVQKSTVQEMMFIPIKDMKVKR